MLEAWLRSYRPEELFDETGAPRAELTTLAPTGERRMGANPHANGGRLQRPLELPDFSDYAVEVPAPGATTAEATRVLGGFLRDVIKANPTSFRLMGPDETTMGCATATRRSSTSSTRCSTSTPSGCGPRPAPAHGRRAPAPPRLDPQTGDDAPGVRDWVWPGAPPPTQPATDTRRGQPA